MTPAQQARTEGFLAALAHRGIALELLPDRQPLTALVEPVEPDQGEFAVARETATGSRVHVLRSHLAGLPVGPGSVFREADSRASHRVAAVVDHPTSVAVVFTCETAAEAEP